MSLADRIPTDKRELDTRRVFNIFCIIGAGFLGCVILFLLLQRVGMPIRLIVTLTGVTLVLAIVALSWMGRTMENGSFFFAGRIAEPASLGIGGLTDWISGGFLILFFSTSLIGKFLLAPALMLGLFLQTALFAMAMQKSNISTLPGFFAWRTQTQFTGLCGLSAVAAILALLIAAEYTVAHTVLEQVTPLKSSTAIWLIIALVALPSLTGGWLSLILVNGALAISVLLCVMLPATVTGFFPDLLKSGLELDTFETTIAPLAAIEETAMGLTGNGDNVLVLLTTALVISAGFSVVPHALSRTTLNAHPTTAMESLGWSALTIFLIFSALPLSIGLIGASPSSSKLALLLKGNSVLHLLPYLAILFAAINALSVTIFSLSSAIVRTTRRSRNLDPGEQSMFAIRVLVILVSLLLIYIPSLKLAAPSTLLVNALALGAAGLFVPLVASVWLATLPSGTIALAILTGGGMVVANLVGSPVIGDWRVLDAGAVGMLTSGTIVFVGWIVQYFRKSEIQDPRLQKLRNPESGT